MESILYHKLKRQIQLKKINTKNPSFSMIERNHFFKKVH